MNSKYYICKKIDEPKRYIGLTLDEFIPIVTISGIFFLLGSLITGFGLAGVVWFVIRHCKKGQGLGWFFNLLYWHLPLEALFTKTPSAATRHWLS